MTSEITPPAANAELVHAGFQAFNAGDVGECLARIAPDLIINLAELPEPQHGRETWRQGFEMMRDAFPDLQAHIEDIVAAQDKVAVRVRFRGTHAGEFLSGSLARTAAKMGSTDPACTKGRTVTGQLPLRRLGTRGRAWCCLRRRMYVACWLRTLRGGTAARTP